MSTQPTPAVARLFPMAESNRRPEPAATSARVRAATVRRRVLLATDVLAAADLLLGINASLRSVGREPDREDAP